jgi:four helix bundle protein
MPIPELKRRTLQFSVDIVRFCRTLPRTDEGRVICYQLLKAGTGVGANYRACCRPRSDADFIAKLGVAIEEADETAFWLEVLVEAQAVGRGRVTKLSREADELTRIFVSSRETARRNARAKRAGRRQQQNREREAIQDSRFTIQD